MGVRKFRNIEEMNAGCDPWLPAGDPRLWEAIAQVWSFARAASGLQFPPGVYKHKSLDDENRLRDEWESASIARRQTQTRQ